MQNCVWDAEKGEMVLKPCSEEEIAEILARRAGNMSPEEHNAPILAALQAIDAKTIRPLRENDAARIAELEQKAKELRNQLMK